METITCVQDNHGVVTLTLQRETSHNTLNPIMIREITHCLQTLNQDPTVRVLIFTATGKSFCAGADLEWMKASIHLTPDKNQQEALALAEMLYQLATFSKPTIAQVQGAALGGGVGLVACCDIAIASSHALFGFSEVKLGLIPAAISPYVVRAMGYRNAQRYFLTAERFTAFDAKALNLLHEVVPPEQLAVRCQELAKQLRHNAPEALSACKQLLQFITETPTLSELKLGTSRRIAECRASAEAQLGISAFLEKQKPAWISDD